MLQVQWLSLSSGRPSGETQTGHLPPRDNEVGGMGESGGAHRW